MLVKRNLVKENSDKLDKDLHLVTKKLKMPNIAAKSSKQQEN